MMKRILLLLVSVLFLLPVYGQSVVYPVHASVNVVPPYSLYLSDYVSGSRDRLVVTLLNRDVQYQSMPVRLRLTIKGSGFTMQTRPYASLPRITLEPNVPYKLTVDDLLPYFDTRNLSSQGLGGDSYLKGGRLPEGMIEFGIEVLEYGTSKVLSQKSAGTAWLSLQKPPVLSLPFNEEVVPWREPLNLMFQWTPQHSGVARVEYELIIKELWDNGLAPESAFTYSPEVFRERIFSTSYLYGVQAPPLEPGRRYAWAVRVVAKDGADDVNIFENDGLSMVRSFRLARYCPEPTQVKARAERGYIQVDWEGSPEHIDYTVAYRIKGSEEWAEVRSSFPSAMLSGVRGGNTYEYRVAGFCEAGIPTFGSIATLTLPSEDTTRLRNCGVLRPVDLSNQEPLEELLSGDQFIAGDFPVHVQEVTGSQGFFTGYGYVHVPFLAFAPFKVTFDNVFINTDRRLIRGVVKTVYDPGESGMSNMNDIFTGGANTGKVVEGITKTDLSADFAIDPTNDFYYDESSGRIEMTDKGGNVIGYIEAGSMVAGGDASGGNSGNESSVFPMTVRDSTGNLYQVEEVPVDETGDVGSTDTGTDASGSKKKLVVKPLGKSGDGMGSDEVNFKRLDSHIAEVEFTDTEGSLYAFDSWKDVYKKSFLIRPKYEQIGENYHVAAKLVPSGKTDRVGAVIKIRDSSVDPLKVVFKTRGGTEFQREGYDAGSGRYVLSVVGGKANDGQELYALYPKKEGGYYNLGKLLIVSYPAYRIKVKIVPVANKLDDFDALRAKLQGIYRRVGIDLDVEKMAVFEYNAPLLFQQKSGLLSAYNAEMKKLNEAYSARNTIDRDASYLFILLYNGQGGDRNYTGYMPLDKQFGYLFRRDFDSFDAFAVAAAHELAHGRLSLRHPFDKSLGLSEGDLAENLMDYRDGTELAKWQWDVIHDPGIVVRIFERDEDAALQGFPDPVCVQKVFENFRAAYVNQTKFTYPATGAPGWGHRATDVQLSDGNVYKSVYVKLFQDMDLVPFEFDREVKKEYWYGKVMQITVQDKLPEFHKYLFPTRDEWDKQINGLISKINTESGRKSLLEMLTILPLSEYERLSASRINEIIRILLTGSLTEDWSSCVNEEEILLTLLKSVLPSGRKEFLHTFEPIIVEMIKKLDGNNRDEALWILSDFIQTAFGGDIRSVTQCYFRSDGSIYNHVFRWAETIGPDPLYTLNLSGSSNRILVSVRNDWWFSDNKHLMELSPYDFVGVELNSELKYKLPVSYQTGDFLVMPALLFHWLCEQRNSDEAWTRFYQGLDLGFTLATVGTYGAAKTGLQVGTTFTIGMSLDYMIRLGINSLVEDDFMIAVEKTSLLDANWNAATMFISNSKMAIVLPCIRESAKELTKDSKTESSVLMSCVQSIVITLITNKLLPDNGKYAKLLYDVIKKNPSQVIGKLKRYGIDSESLLALVKLLFLSPADQSLKTYLIEQINESNY